MDNLEMRNLLRAVINPDDIIACIIAFLPNEFPADTAVIHRAFFELGKREKYKYLLKDFEFIDRYPYPYSPLLERVFARLQESRLLSARNPDFITYEMKEDSKKAIEDKIIDKFKNPEDRIKLKEMANELSEALGN